MTKICSDCGEELEEGFFSSIIRCEKCRRYLCKNCARETGEETYCKKCFRKERQDG